MRLKTLAGSAVLLFVFLLILLFIFVSFKEFGEANQNAFPEVVMAEENSTLNPTFSVDTKISDVISAPAFKGYGKLIFPVNQAYMSGDTLGNLSLAWYNNIDPNKTVEIVNYFKDQVDLGNQIFYPIYSQEEIERDPDKANTGLFFFRGEPDERVAVVNAGGGFAYVGAMHDSFPQALELSKMGYNAFALIYRPNYQTACEDLSRALTVISNNAEELGVDMDSYSLWGGSAGARMAATVGSYSPAAFGGANLARPAAVITQYSGHNTYSEFDPPTYANVGDSDGIANWRVMQQRLQALESLGIPTEFHVYPGLRHGFGLGTGTIAEGWIKDAADFWQEQIRNREK